MSLLVVGCSPGPGSKQPALGDAGPPAAKSAEASAVAATAAPPESGLAVPVPKPGGATPPPEAAGTRPAPRQQPTQAPVPPVEPAPTRAAAPQPAVDQATPAPRPEATKAALDPPPAQAAARAPIAVDIGGLVEVGATKPGLSPIGAGKCKLCHKIQFDSWSRTAHAARTPPLDCEACHGPGSEYKTLAIMKDPKKARAAGMVIPARSFCAKCHTSGWSDDLLKRSHAHKAGA